MTNAIYIRSNWNMLRALALCGLLIVTISCDKGTNSSTPPFKTLELLQPRGGESYKVNQTVAIRWRINDTSNISTVGIMLSLDGGKTWPLSLGNGSFPPETTSFSWTIESTQVSDQCMIKVYDYISQSINDRSGVFLVSR
jgi:hypothetical protein